MAPQTSSFACYMWPHSGPFLSFLAYYIWGLPQISFFTYYGGLLMSFFILYGGPSDHFFAYYIGAPRSLSSLTIWSPSDHFLLIQYGVPSQISFIVYYMAPPPQISFFACYMGGHLTF